MTTPTSFFTLQHTKFFAINKMFYNNWEVWSTYFLIVFLEPQQLLIYQAAAAMLSIVQYAVYWWNEGWSETQARIRMHVQVSV